MSIILQIKRETQRAYSLQLTQYVPRYMHFLQFAAFFHVASLFSTGVDNEKVGVDNEKALELDKRIVFSYFSLISI